MAPPSRVPSAYRLLPSAGFGYAFRATPTLRRRGPRPRFEDERLFDSYPAVMLDHQLGQLRPIDEHDASVDPLGIDPSVGAEATCSDENATGRLRSIP